MAIASVDDIVAGFNTAQQKRWFKVIAVPKAIGAFVSLWATKGVPAAGATSPAYTAGSGYTCSSATAGALDYANATNQNYLSRAWGGASQQGTLILVDRLWSCSGMGFAASTYSVTTPGSLPARITDGGLGCELWVEQFAAAGVASGSLTANYKNSAGSAKSGVLTPVLSAPLINQMQYMPLADNLGISQLTSVVNTNTWTSGSWGMTICKRICELPCPIVGTGWNHDFADIGLPQIPNDACLAWIWMATAATTANAIGSLSIIDK